MVQVKYKGQNSLRVGNYKIVNGFNEIKDDDFYHMMESKTFKFRVQTNILEVPANFPLVKPEPISSLKEVPVKKMEEEDKKKSKEIKK